MAGKGGEVSETSQMTPQGGADGIPGTDDGVPPAAATGQEADGAPRDYPGEATD